MMLNLLQNPYKLQSYLVVWYNDKDAERKHYCQCLYTKDYWNYRTLRRRKNENYYDFNV